MAEILNITLNLEALGDEKEDGVRTIFLDLADRLAGHPHLSAGHSQPITWEGKEIGWVDVFEKGA